MRIITISISFLLFLACNNSKKELQQEFPKRIDDRLYTTDSTFHFMDGNDTITKLLHKNTLELVK